MGLSKIFPCCRKPKPSKQTRPSQDTTPDKNNVSSAPPELPPVGNVLNHSTTEVQPSKEPPASEKPQKRGPVTSEEVWNCAYNELAGDEATASLVEAYVKVLPKAINPNKDSNEPDNKEADKLHDDMNNPIQRQKMMQSAINAGQAKIAKPSKATQAVGSVSSFVLKFKGVIDMAVQSNPQAALPWAGVCVGLQVS